MNTLHDLNAEQALLGSVIQYGNKTYLAACRFIPTAEAFYDIRHAAIWALMGDMVSTGQQVSEHSLASWVLQSGKAMECGGLGYVDELSSHAVCSVPDYHASIVAEFWQKRRVVAACQQGVAVLQTPDGTNEQVDRVIASVIEAGKGVTVANEASMASLMPAYIDRVEAACNGLGKTGLKTGLDGLDSVIGGLRNKEMIVLGARPSVGKTAIAMQIACKVAMKDQIPVGVFSCEMDRDSIVDRAVSTLSGVPMVDVRAGALDQHDLVKIKQAVDQCRKAKLYIDDTTNLTAAQFNRRALQMVEERNCGLIVLDYLQLMSGDGRKTRYEVISEISRSVKQTAKTCGVPIFVLAQLSRESDKTQREPRSSDLRESGQIEQDADVIILAHRLDPAEVDQARGIRWAEALEPDDKRDIGTPWHNWGRCVNLIVDKNRNGVTGLVKTFMQCRTMRFQSL